MQSAVIKRLVLVLRIMENPRSILGKNAGHLTDMIRVLPKLVQKNTQFLKADDDCSFCPHPFYFIIHGHPPFRRQKGIIFDKRKINKAAP
jgi:hypothetical protein